MSRFPTAEETAVEYRKVVRVYGILAKVYDEGFDWALGPGRRRAIEALAPAPGARVLEVGVGTGLSLPLYPPGVHVSGIDISEAMLDRARARLESLGRDDVDLRMMDATDLAYGDGTFDAVFAPYVISVVPNPRRVMDEISRVCRPGGTVVIVNHFGSRSPGLRRIEGMLNPLTQWLGFRLDVPVETVTATPGLTLVRTERVNLFGHWSCLVLRRGR